MPRCSLFRTFSLVENDGNIPEKEIRVTKSAIILDDRAIREVLQIAEQLQGQSLEGLIEACRLLEDDQIGQLCTAALPALEAYERLGACLVAVAGRRVC